MHATHAMGPSVGVPRPRGLGAFCSLWYHWFRASTGGQGHAHQSTATSCAWRLAAGSSRPPGSRQAACWKSATGLGSATNQAIARPGHARPNWADSNWRRRRPMSACAALPPPVGHGPHPCSAGPPIAVPDRCSFSSRIGLTAPAVVSRGRLYSPPVFGMAARRRAGLPGRPSGGADARPAARTLARCFDQFRASSRDLHRCLIDLGRERWVGVRGVPRSWLTIR